MIEIIIVLTLLSISTSILGSFLVLKNMSMLADAIAHSVLLGIVLALIIEQNVDSYLVILFSSLFGVVTVLAISLLSKNNKIKDDDAIGVVFPIFFSLAIILINVGFKNVHIDTESIIMGEVLFLGFDTFNFLGINIAVSIIKTFILMLVNLLFILAFYNNIKFASFDEEFSKMKGIKSNIILNIFVIITSFTIVISFKLVGSILVLSLFITPVSTAFLYTKKLKNLIVYSIFISVINIIIATFIAFKLNVSISGMIAFLGMVIFVLSLLINKNGILMRVINRGKLRIRVKEEIFLIHLYNHLKDGSNSIENEVSKIPKHLNWDIIEIEKISNILIRKKLIKIYNNEYMLTNLGIEYSKKLFLEYKIS